MKVTGIKTHKITKKDTDLFEILDTYLPKLLEEKSIVVITSKIVSIIEGRIVEIKKVSKEEEITQKDMLIEHEAEWYLPRSSNKYNVNMTITRGNLVASAGIDESNGNGYFILWPENPQKTANSARSHLAERFGVKNVGVIITDSKTTPLRWGVTAIGIGYSGFVPLKNYIGKPDIFGKNLEYTKMSLVDNLASAAALVMGEGGEQTPLALVQDLDSIEFQEQDPTEEELKDLKINREDDLYVLLLKSVKWEKGNKG